MEFRYFYEGWRMSISDVEWPRSRIQFSHVEKGKKSS